MDDRFFSIDQLQRWEPQRPFLAVLGNPIRHSLSPDMHQAALAELAGDEPAFTSWRYYGIEVPAEELERVLGLLWERGCVGVNLTVPHKVEVLGLLQEATEEARLMGAANTLTRTERFFEGTNTDGYGMARAIEQCFGFGLAGKHILVLGAGGAARAIAVRCLRDACQSLTVANRNPDRLEAFGRQLELRSGPVSQLRLLSLEKLEAESAHYDLIINATTLGLYEGDSSPLPVSKLDGESCVYDTTYGVRNQLARDCNDAGVRYADGLHMLAWQGAKSLETWTGRSVNAATMLEAARAALAERMNRE